ncbi:hypothetical protein [Eisenibacter elegans]|uniref:hypothetical protein n=1 Tax=Eisenibacter elegans TaxID=997 RepID=UPI0012B59DBA|nr:hypothetical protein [Eisenibacter elegans]
MAEISTDTVIKKQITMAKNKKLSTLTLEELFAEKKKRQVILMGLGIAMLTACGIFVFLAIKNKNYALIVIASGCLITLQPLISNLNQVKKEIQKREQK